MGEGQTFVASSIAARAGKASRILRYRLNGRSKEKVLGRYPELSLKDAVGNTVTVSSIDDLLGSA